ncbi:MAG: bifunctional diaminohydroxyphosphoribosylaminopyrimidine deaminase/5-amino-6-(5-phosphoribosylamino)uracil reductase RibD [Acidobacteria bacterium]|nr:bifunctional diaminohydroxyphosphoribosylaminopyrimidine deaminase/5-amino-6-(5-phosphoribosylamino)uracil reductase RibD [Acidobacteriota bacterium]
MKPDDERWMRRALELAARGAGETNPNPMVGCVVVRSGRVVGEGWHRRAGGPHAEVTALRRAGARARGATLYVTLEPCAHQGRTAPCAPLVAAAGVRRVVAAVRDPNPLVNGRGLGLVRRRGLEVSHGVLAAEAERLNVRFLTAARARRPFVLLKAAITLDGRIATARGESKWITSAAQRRAARSLRRLHDAVAVGIGTVLADDPLLLPRPAVARPFHRVVFDSRLRLPLRSRLVRTARRAPVLLLCHSASPARRRALEARGVTVVPCPGRDGRVSLSRALDALRERGIGSLMVEGGSELLGSFLGARLVDQVALFRAPLLLGGRGGRPAFGGPDPPRLGDALPLHRVPSPGDHYELWEPVGSSAGRRAGRNRG